MADVSVGLLQRRIKGLAQKIVKLREEMADLRRRLTEAETALALERLRNRRKDHEMPQPASPWRPYYPRRPDVHW